MAKKKSAKKQATKKSNKKATKQDPTVEHLSTLLASSYTLYLKTQNFHWNVTGPMFTTLHTLFEMQYTEYAASIDEIAERIRALGEFAPGSFTDFGKLSTVKECTSRPDAKAMIKELVDDQHAIVAICKKLINAAEDAGDAATADLATRRCDVHDKNAWMLSSHLD